MPEDYTPLTDAELDTLVSRDGTALISQCFRAAAEIRALRASEARLLAALKEYGLHKDACATRYEWHKANPCNCGFDTIVVAAGVRAE